ncbi:hypothetical protein LBMAG53_38370 [Planctomycetota bacterium]|nr:hypothetical protein LBMAG53_38370 [Planctomycetota bacterium]
MTVPARLTIRSALDYLKRQDVDNRILAAQELWDSALDGAPPLLAADEIELKQEVDARLAQYRQDGIAYSSEEAKAYLERNRPRRRRTRRA